MTPWRNTGERLVVRPGHRAPSLQLSISQLTARLQILLGVSAEDPSAGSEGPLDSAMKATPAATQKTTAAPPIGTANN